MTIQAIFTVDEDIDFDNLPPAMTTILELTGEELALSIMPGCQAYNGKIPVHMHFKNPAATFENITVTMGIVAALGFTINLEAAQSLKNQESVKDEDNNIIGYAPKVHKPVPMNFIDFLADINNEDGTTSRPDVNNWQVPHNISGAAEWVISDS